jgi:hypothetical protein
VRQPSRHRARVLGPAALALVLLATACGTEPDREPERPRPQPPADRPGLLWVGDLETGDLSQYKDTPWNVTRGGLEPEVVSDPRFVREGRYALKIAIPTGETDDKEGACCDPRSEVEPDIGDIREGDDLWFGFSTLLAADFPVDEDWQVVTQWKARADGSPPVSFKVKNGRYLLSGGEGHPDEEKPFDRELAPAEPGTWSDWVVHIRFATEPRDGFVEVWRNGMQVLERFSPEGGTMYPADKGGESPESYLKTGYYRSEKITRPGVLYYDGWRVGSSREAVSPA